VPRRSVKVPVNEFRHRCDKYDKIISGTAGLHPSFRWMVGELILLRLFDDFQEMLEGVAVRLACGASYADGTMPILLASPARSTSGAIALFETHGRLKPKQMKWSNSTFIGETTKNVMAANDSFMFACNAHAQTIEQMRVVRNRIAHANSKTRNSFSSVVVQHYGARLNHVTPGKLLLTPRFGTAILSIYLSTCRVISRIAIKL
jgi:hypothetical protein